MLSLLRGPMLAALSWLLATAGGTRAPSRHLDRGHERPAEVPEVPTALLDVLGVETNVAGSCHAVSVPRWSHDAEECTYESAGRTWTLTTATPTATRTARWIVDASSFIPSVSGLRARDHAAWEDALVVMAKHTIAQSGRVFPLDGVVWENFEGPTGYVFHDGVTYGTFGGPLASCRACACRIDSLHRSQWCAYESGVLGVEPYDACLASLGGESGWNDAWARQCRENHDAAWDMDRNASYRAIAYFIQEHQMGPQFPSPGKADPSAVVAALERAYARPYAKSP